MGILDFLRQLFSFWFSNPAKIVTSGTSSLFPQITTETSPNEAKPAIPGLNRALITIPEHINARFDDTGSPAWANQPGGKHLGTDFGAPNGSNVYAPWDMTVVSTGSYKDEGRRGNYVIGTLNDGTEYYSGHLGDIAVKPGDKVHLGQKIGQIGYYNHTHIQLRINGQLSDFEKYGGPK